MAGIVDIRRIGGRHSVERCVDYNSNDPISYLNREPSFNRFTIVGQSYRDPVTAP
jgi:hypothetical protein